MLVVSDLHFGEPHSVLTDRDDQGRLVGNAVMDGVTGALARIATSSDTPPMLVFNGDALELAMAPTHVALDVFDQFVKRLFPPGGAALVAPRIVVLPGNHDHDVWRMSRDEIEAREVERAAADAPMPLAQPVTPIFGALDPGGHPVPSDLLTRVLRHRNPTHPDLEVVIASPSAATGTGNRMLTLHHGHFTEGIYVAMTRLAHTVFGAPIDELGPWDLERDNGPWIDFVWSSLGREGAVGESIRRSYDLLNTDPGRALLASKLAAAAQGRNGPKVVQHLRRAVAGIVALRLLDGVKEDELRANAPDRADAATGVMAYIDGPLAKNLEVGIAGADTRFPDELVFLYGHTHKPFASCVTSPRYAGTVRVYNSGGWVVDSPAVRAGTGGAVLVVDDTLDVALVHLGDQAEDPGAITGTVDHADGPDTDSPLVARLREQIAHDPTPWGALADATRDTVRRRRGEHARNLDHELATTRRETGARDTVRQMQHLLRRQRRVERREDERMRPHEARAWLARGSRSARTFFGRR
ncbi:MAG: hypothetical protein ACXW2Y_00890 [Acidimicrobiia bacterium]